MKYTIFLLFLVFRPLLFLKPPNICTNCKFYKKDFLFDSKKYGTCTLFPREEENNIDFLVYGKKTNIIYYYCSTARQFSDMCGKEGKHYKPRT